MTSGVKTCGLHSSTLHVLLLLPQEMSTLELFKFNVAPLTKTIGASNKIRFSNKICNIFHMQHGLEHPYESMCGMWTVCAIAPSAENVKLTK